MGARVPCHIHGRVAVVHDAVSSRDVVHTQHSPCFLSLPRVYQLELFVHAEFVVVFVVRRFIRDRPDFDSRLCLRCARVHRFVHSPGTHRCRHLVLHPRLMPNRRAVLLDAVQERAHVDLIQAQGLQQTGEIERLSRVLTDVLGDLCRL